MMLGQIVRIMIVLLVIGAGTTVGQEVASAMLQAGWGGNTGLPILVMIPIPIVTAGIAAYLCFVFDPSRS